MSGSDQWYGGVTYAEDIASDASAGFQLMERWNTPNTSFELSGTKECMENLSHYLVTGTKEALARLGVNCEIIMGDSKEHECPVDMTYEKVVTYPGIPLGWQGKGIWRYRSLRSVRRGRLKGGWLKSTGTVEKIEGEDAFELGYHAPYAHRQHEDLTYRHTKPGTKAKYLEDPVMRRLPLIAEDIGAHLRGLFG